MAAHSKILRTGKSHGPEGPVGLILGAAKLGQLGKRLRLRATFYKEGTKMDPAQKKKEIIITIYTEDASEILRHRKPGGNKKRLLTPLLRKQINISFYRYFFLLLG